MNSALKHFSPVNVQKRREYLPIVYGLAVHFLPLILFFFYIYCEDSSSTDEVASRQLVTLKVLYLFQSEQCGFYGGRSDKGIYFPPST